MCWVCARGRAAPTLRRNTHNTRNTQTCTIRKHWVCWIECVHAVAPHRLSDAIHTIHAIHKHVQCIHVRSRASYKELKLARNACSILATVAAMYTHVWIFIFPYFITGIRTSVFITDFRMKYGKSVLLGSSDICLWAFMTIRVMSFFFSCNTHTCVNVNPKRPLGESFLRILTMIDVSLPRTAPPVGLCRDTVKRCENK